MTGKIGWAGAAIALGLAAAGWHVLGGGTPQEAKKNPLGDRDLGVYYRMTAEYTYKGEPLVLDFGISCTSIWSDPNQHKYSMDVTAGPKLYGVRTKDNKAVVISTRSYCDTLRPSEPNWGAPDDFLPLTFVYDDPDTLYSSVLYASDEAYRNASSVLTIPKVRFERLTADQLLDLRRRQHPNVVRSVKNDGRAPPGYRPPGNKHAIQGDCPGVAKLTLTDYGRERVRAQWPSDRPDFWTLNTDPVIDSIIRQRQPETVVGVDGKSVALFVSLGRESGLPRTKGWGARLYGGGRIHYVPPYYPIVLRSGPVWDATLNTWTSEDLHYDIDLREEVRGMMFCGNPVTRGPPSEGALLGNPHKKSVFRERHHTSRLTAAGQPILGADGRPIVGKPSLPIVYRDEFILTLGSMGNGSDTGEQGDE